MPCKHDKQSQSLADVNVSPPKARARSRDCSMFALRNANIWNVRFHLRQLQWKCKYMMLNPPYMIWAWMRENLSAPLLSATKSSFLALRSMYIMAWLIDILSGYHIISNDSTVNNPLYTNGFFILI